MPEKIWFIDDEHRLNFTSLLQRFGADAEYASACYVCAVPSIYKRIDWAKNMDN